MKSVLNSTITFVICKLLMAIMFTDHLILLMLLRIEKVLKKINNVTLMCHNFS